MRNVKRHVFFGVVIFCLTALNMTTAQGGSPEEASKALDIDAVWSESNGLRHEIFHAWRQAGQWSAPVMITDDRFDNLHPVLDRDSQGRLWLVWSAYDNQRMELRYASGKDGVWQDGSTIPTAMAINMSPSLVVDGNDVVWLVWSANNGGPDDIYYAVHDSGAWSEPALVHVANGRADVLPMIDINQEGRPVVFWKGMVDNRYETFASEYVNGDWSPEELLPELDAAEKEDEDEEMALPSFINKNGAVFLRIY